MSKKSVLFNLRDTKALIRQAPYLLASKQVLVAQLCPTLCNPMDLQPTRLLCPRDFPGKDTGVGSHFLLQGIFPTQGSNPGLPHCRQTLYWLSYKGSPLSTGRECKSVQLFWKLIWQTSTRTVSCSNRSSSSKSRLLSVGIIRNVDSDWFIYLHF